jgi:4-oxalocrotonate tautomerase
MPFIHLQITRDGATREQKAQVIAEFTETLQRVLGKDPVLTHIVIDEIDTDNWGWQGETTTVIRSRPPRG